MGGDYEKMIETNRELRFASYLTIILIYLVLASLFESYSQPFIIMLSVPLASIGVINGLLWAHKTLNMGALIGIIMVGGISVNGPVILVDRINFLRREKNLPLLDCVCTAAKDRLRPILMTTSTTIIGLLPMALDRSEAANLWSPLAIAVIGGLISSTIPTLFVVPALYLAFEDIKARVFNVGKMMNALLKRGARIDKT